MRHLLLTLGAASGALLAAGCTVPRPWGTGVAFHTLASVGARALEHEDRSELDGGDAYGLQLLTHDGATGWGYELGGTYSAEESGGERDHEAEFDEVYLGLRRTWVRDGRSAQPYVGFGGGLTRVEHTLRDPTSEFEDEGGAAYLRGGVLWGLGRFALDERSDFLLGFDLRGLVGDDYDAVELSLVVGAGG